MASCKQCIHYELCYKKPIHSIDTDLAVMGGCSDFKDKSRCIELPCKVGDTVYLIKDNFIEPCEVEGIYFTRRKKYVRVRPFHQEYIGNWSIYYTPSIRSFGKTVFLSYEEAEKALSEFI